MTEFIIRKLPYDLSSHAGLAFIGKYLKSFKINSMIDSAFPVRSGVGNCDILKSNLGLLGKNDLDAIENFRAGTFSCAFLDCAAVLRVPPCGSIWILTLLPRLTWNPK